MSEPTHADRIEELCDEVDSWMRIAQRRADRLAQANGRIAELEAKLEQCQLEREAVNKELTKSEHGIRCLHDDVFELKAKLNKAKNRIVALERTQKRTVNDWCRGIELPDGECSGCSCDCPACEESKKRVVELEAKPTVCEWSLICGSLAYRTTCGHSWYAASVLTFCLFCGGKIKEGKNK